MRYLLCALAVLTLTACASPPESGSAATTPPPSGSSSGPDQDRMIGFRLKRLDQLIETTFDRLLGNAGLNRREWQTLNVISRGPVDDAQLTDALRPFWEANGEKVSDVIESLAVRDWIHRDADGWYAMTAAGRDVHAAAANEVGGLRDLMAEGVGAEEFAQMMDVLGRMTVNLEKATPTTGK
ncbi:MarR family winged helix-turn-helix transcriptional regulator [Nocardia cyriacigeorgica]|uniref:MarR family winged helix-turn-helix transcriptional regulator n=1 Tax=Nocardia cyriacigeorgica TaxID=135487 RepID=UPI002455DFCA|nr:MarR family transcriptional regulator [Nocardia cyriacigeorgica]